MCLNEHPIRITSNVLLHFVSVFLKQTLFFTFCGLQLLPENIHELADGKLHISATDVYTGKNIEVYIFI